MGWVYYKILLAKLTLFFNGGLKHEHYILRSSLQKKRIYFPKPFYSFGSRSGKSVLYLSLIFFFRKGGALLHALPFKHSWWFYFQLRIFRLVTDVLILSTEIEWKFFYYTLNSFKTFTDYWTLNANLHYQPSVIPQKSHWSQGGEILKW